MEIHNMAEDWVIAKVNSVCDSIEKDEKHSSLCTCEQCRIDTVCYVLNRAAPYYVVSHRGVTRANQESFAAQQNRVDLTTLVYEGIRLVNHNQRVYAHQNTEKPDGEKTNFPVFNIPMILGRVINGLNFSPGEDSVVELFRNGSLVHMRDINWQNPYKIVRDTDGAFSFWPTPEPVPENGIKTVFQFAVKISGGGYEDFYHSFSVPLTSEVKASSFSTERTFKLPDFYIFPPGEENAQRVISDD